MANEDKATRYHRLQRRASAIGIAVTALVLAGLVLGGGALWLRHLVERMTDGSFALSVSLYVIVIALVGECVQLPFAYYQGVTLEQRYGLSTGRPARWWLDRVRANAVGLALAVAAGLIVYALLRWISDYWWIAAAAAFTALLILLARVAPVLLMPIFYRFTPLDRPALVERLTALARRADADVIGVFEWQLSDRTRKANAALTGIGATRRILLSDTLLAEHSDDEIEVIMAHELAHHVHRDIWAALAVDAVVIAAGFFAADRVLTAAGPWLELTGKADLAGLPVLVLTAAAASMLLVPAAHAVSRAHERRADRYALDLTGNGEAFVSSMKRLSATNLAEDRPSRMVEMLFYSHPPARARISAAEVWMSRRSESASGRGR